MSFGWMSNPQYLAQVGHFLGAYSLVLTSAVFLSPGTFWVVFVIAVIAATFKEFVFDVASWGEGDSWADSAMDWAFYMLGGVVGLGAAALLVMVHR
jgi:ABC-type nickel/cobalt efflux system permease component RcnA